MLAGVLQRCRLVIGIDTGALHLAAAVGTRCLGLYFVSMNFRETGPYGEGHIVITPNDMDYPCHEREMESKATGFGGRVPSEAVTGFLKGSSGTNLQIFDQVSIFRSFMSESGLQWREVVDPAERINLSLEYCFGSVKEIEQDGERVLSGILA